MDTKKTAPPAGVMSNHQTWTPNMTHAWSEALQNFVTPPPTPPLIAEVIGTEGDMPSLNPVPGIDVPEDVESAKTEQTPLLGKTADGADKEQDLCAYLGELITPSVIMGTISAVCAMLYTTGTKVATDQALSPGSAISVPFLLLLRGIVGVSICSYEAFYLEGQSFPPGTPEQLPLMGTAGVMTMLGIASGLYATSMWGNASVACIVNTSPALTVILTAIICIPDLHEPINLGSLTMLIIAITGMILVTRPEFIWGANSSTVSNVGLLPPLAACGQACTQSITALMIRKIPNKPSAASITFYVQFTMLIFGFVLTTYDVYGLGHDINVNWNSPAGPISGMLLVAICGTGANYFKNKALRMSKSVLVVGLRFFTPILCYIADAILMQFSSKYTIHSDIYSYVGCALIIIAGVMLLVLKRQREAAKDAAKAAEKAEPLDSKAK